MSSSTPPVPPLPQQPADDAARAASAAYDPAADPDDTGVPSILGAHPADIGRGFFRALFDVSFRTFITRRLASVFYVAGLIAIAVGFLVYAVGGLVRGISSLWYNPGAGISLIVATVVLVPLFTFIAIVVLRFVIEGLVALIAIAENTERTAENTRRRD
jgi:hypothetical protein